MLIIKTAGFLHNSLASFAAFAKIEIFIIFIKKTPAGAFTLCRIF